MPQQAAAVRVRAEAPARGALVAPVRALAIAAAVAVAVVAEAPVAVVVVMMAVMVMAVVMMTVVMMMVMAMSVCDGRTAHCEARTGCHDKRSTTQRFRQVKHDVHSWGLRDRSPQWLISRRLPSNGPLGPAHRSRHEAQGFTGLFWGERIPSRGCRRFGGPVTGRRAVTAPGRTS